MDQGSVDDVLGNSLYLIRNRKTDIVTKRHVDQIIAVTDFCTEPQGSGSINKSQEAVVVPCPIPEIVREEETDDSFNSACSLVGASDSDSEFTGFSQEHLHVNKKNNVNDQILKRNVNVDISLNNENNSKNTLNRNVRPKRNVKAQKRLIEEI